MSGPAWIDDVRRAVLAGAVAHEPLPVGICRSEDEFGLVLTMEPPLDAQMLCRGLGFVAPVAVSFDVHQDTWWVVEAGEEMADPHGRRITCHDLTWGDWGIRPRLTGRPRGDLPAVSCGASPAYDVTTSVALVGWIHIGGARP